MIINFTEDDVLDTLSECARLAKLYPGHVSLVYREDGLIEQVKLNNLPGPLTVLRKRKGNKKSLNSISDWEFLNISYDLNYDSDQPIYNYEDVRKAGEQIMRNCIE